MVSRGIQRLKPTGNIAVIENVYMIGMFDHERYRHHTVKTGKRPKHYK